MSDTTELSKQLADKMDGVVNEVLADNGGGVVVGFTCFVQYIGEDGERNFTFFCEDGQTIMATMGHMAYMNKIVDGEMDRALGRSDR